MWTVEHAKKIKRYFNNRIEIGATTGAVDSRGAFDPIVNIVSLLGVPLVSHEKQLHQYGSQSLNLTSFSYKERETQRENFWEKRRVIDQ